LTTLIGVKFYFASGASWVQCLFFSSRESYGYLIFMDTPPTSTILKRESLEEKIKIVTKQRLIIF